MKFTIYLAGEIHSDWRNELIKKVTDEGLGENFDFVGPQTQHDLSDDIGEQILGKQPNNYFRDDAASQVNNFRTTLLMEKSDIVIAKFGEDYRQWNTAMDATTAINKHKPLIIIRPESLIHALKELSNKANIVTDDINAVVDVLAYVLE